MRTTTGKLDRVHAACSLRVPEGITFGDVGQAVGRLVVPVDAVPCEEVGGMTYDVRVCFCAEGVVVDGVGLGG